MRNKSNDTTHSVDRIDILPETERTPQLAPTIKTIFTRNIGQTNDTHCGIRKQIHNPMVRSFSFGHHLIYTACLHMSNGERTHFNCRQEANSQREGRSMPFHGSFERGATVKNETRNKRNASKRLKRRRDYTHTEREEDACQEIFSAGEKFLNGLVG